MFDSARDGSHYKSSFRNVLPNIVTVQVYSDDHFLSSIHGDDESFFSDKLLFKKMSELYVTFGALTMSDRHHIMSSQSSVPIKFSKRYDPLTVFSCDYSDGSLRWVEDELLPDKNTIFVPRKLAERNGLSSTIVIKPAIPRDVRYDLSSALQGP